MPQIISHSSRRLVAVLALATTTAVPALVIIAGQTPASEVAVTMSPNSNKMH